MVIEYQTIFVILVLAGTFMLVGLLSLFVSDGDPVGRTFFKGCLSIAAALLLFLTVNWVYLKFNNLDEHQEKTEKRSLRLILDKKPRVPLGDLSDFYKKIQTPGGFVVLPKDLKKEHNIRNL